MSSKIALIYEKDSFVITVNESVVDTEQDMNIAIESFKQVIKNNSDKNNVQAKTWEEILEIIKEIDDDRLVVNSEYKNIAFDTMRFFYNTGKLFYMNSNGMSELIGGIGLFHLVADMVSRGKVSKVNDILDFCKEILECKVSYGVSQEGILVASPAFSYGTVEYNFETGKIHKGTAIEKADFSEYKAYVLRILNKGI